MNFLARKQKVQNLCQYSESFWQTWFNYINKHRHHSILLACKEKKQKKTKTNKNNYNKRHGQSTNKSHITITCTDKSVCNKVTITARRQDFSEGVS